MGKPRAKPDDVLQRCEKIYRQHINRRDGIYRQKMDDLATELGYKSRNTMFNSITLMAKRMGYKGYSDYFNNSKRNQVAYKNADGLVVRPRYMSDAQELLWFRRWA